VKKIILSAAIIIPLVWLVNFYWQNLRGLKPAILPAPAIPTSTQSPGINSTGLPLSLPKGFSISIFASDLGNPRDLEFDPTGNLLVSIPSRGQVVLLPDKKIIVSGLNRPHGLAYTNGHLYIAEEDKVTIDGKKILDLPEGGNHVTRSLLVKDNQLYISIGSSCNVCHEPDPHRAAIYVSNLDGSSFRSFATGLRNSVFMTLDSQKNIWATDMGRDLIGNDTPPDEINIIGEGNYGWPICYGQNIHDTNFDKNTYIRNPCQEPLEKPSFIDLPAHSAPLGLAFIPDSWPQNYRGKLLVAYHGSWNRNPPTGYKIVIIDPKTKQITDFITGFEPKADQPLAGALGRPVDLIFDSSGNLYVSDDKKGVVYQVIPPTPEP